MAKFDEVLKAKLRRASRRALFRLGDAWLEELRERISVPVEGSGRNAVRSKPGQPPRKEIGRLYGSVTFRVEPGYDFESLRMICRSPIGKILHRGTEDNRILPRPWWPEDRELRQKRRMFKVLLKEELAREETAEEAAEED